MREISDCRDHQPSHPAPAGGALTSYSNFVGSRWKIFEEGKRHRFGCTSPEPNRFVDEIGREREAGLDQIGAVELVMALAAHATWMGV